MVYNLFLIAQILAFDIKSVGKDMNVIMPMAELAAVRRSRRELGFALSSLGEAAYGRYGMPPSACGIGVRLLASCVVSRASDLVDVHILLAKHRLWMYLPVHDGNTKENINGSSSKSTAPTLQTMDHFVRMASHAMSIQHKVTTQHSEEVDCLGAAMCLIALKREFAQQVRMIRDWDLLACEDPKYMVTLLQLYHSVCLTMKIVHCSLIDLPG